MKAQQKYWDKKITEWSSISYDKTSQASLIEKLATPFRRADLRVLAASSLLAPLIKGKSLLFLGCGVGNECFAILSHSPKKVIGIDISPVAIAQAKKNAKKHNVEKKIDFLVGDVGSIKELPDSDYVLGLGFIDYLTKKELKNLFELVMPKKFLFSYFEKKLTLFNLIHTLYVKSQRCPGAFKYSRQEINEIMPKKTEHYFLKKDGLLFLTNISDFKKKLEDRSGRLFFS